GLNGDKPKPPSRIVSVGPAPWIVSRPVIDGSAFPPNDPASTTLSATVKVYVPAARMIVSGPWLSFALWMLPTRQKMSPELQEKTCAGAPLGTPTVNTKAMATAMRNR